MNTQSAMMKAYQRPSKLARHAAHAAAASAALAILSLAALHVAQPELSPLASMMSQYANGPHGWLMNFGFACFAAASLFLLAALAEQPKSLLRFIGLFALLMAAIGLSFGAVFNMDPATADPSQMSLSGQMHGFAFMIGVPGELIAVATLSFALNRAPWRRPALIAAALLVWVSLVVMAINLSAWMQAGQTGLAIFGVPNRTFMIGYGLWIIVAAWPIARGHASIGSSAQR